LPGDTGPDNPFFPVAESVNDPPAGFSYQHIVQLYISRSANPPAPTIVPDNTLTLRGDLQADGPVIVGRSSGIAGMSTNGKIIHQSGFFNIALGAMDLGNSEGSPRAGFGNGVYDYQGGILEVSLEGGAGLRVAHGSSAGTGGRGRFIMHNPTTPGYVRAYDFLVASHLGVTVGVSPNNANGDTRGQATIEFHYENGGTRPIQVLENLDISNGTFTNGSGVTGTRSARLALVLDEAPCTGAACVPEDIGLFDVDFFDPDQLVDPTGTNTGGEGSLGDFFSSADGSTLYSPDSLVSAVFGSTQYNWTIKYNGEITWADPDLGTIDSIAATGDLDVVLIGHSSVSLGLTGDYNDDGKVDAADYVVFRKNEGTMNSLPNDPVGGTIGSQQYNNWRANFGMMAGSGAGAGTSAVPEPGSFVIALAAMLAAALLRRR
jgi:hypothetical protein